MSLRRENACAEERVDKLEKRMYRIEKSRDRIGITLGTCMNRQDMHIKEADRRLRTIEFGVTMAILLDVLLAAALLFVAFNVR